jgi:hypothetical protein
VVEELSAALEEGAMELALHLLDGELQMCN